MIPLWQNAKEISLINNNNIKQMVISFNKYLAYLASMQDWNYIAVYDKKK